MIETLEPKPGADRRAMMKGALALGVLGPAFAATAARAAEPAYPAAAFAAKDVDAALTALFGAKPAASDKITLDAPEIAENGAVVPVTASTTLDGVTAIAFVVAENPFKLASYYELPAGVLPTVSNRLKMQRTTQVMAVFKTAGGLFSASREVKVTIGGCGG
ncbi:MAG: thiosulfate oxidation carrier protein SoxY [Hyphomicrobiales bacterium]|nr:thiosulfate oxidation carrier protein SoxY [Hyphomicrobiales bacterium]MDE2017868.1 thiosulfate oxidation carrier protein SoxY [Hyphomicrobiales bacterium]